MLGVSIVIATYNRSSLLRNTLDSLVGLERPPEVEMEVIICDDGSSDDTFAVFKAFEDKLNIYYYYQPDQGYRLALARNMGVRLARGTLILLLDCGIFAPPDLLKEHLLAHTISAGRSVVIGPIHGHSTEEKTFWEQVRLEKPDWWRAFLENRAAMDVRMPLWESVNFHIDRLNVPWSMCWGCNISMSRAQFLEAGGFDETFVGWGGEDIDLAYRLHKHGLSFYVNDKAFIIHLPHDTSMRKSNSNQIHKKQIYSKDPVLETELLVCCSVMNYCMEFPDIVRSVRQRLIPDYLEQADKSSLHWLKHAIGSPAWLYGGGGGDLAAFLDCTCMCEPDQEKLKRARYKYPWLDVRCCMGVNTGLGSEAIETIVITDFWRGLPKRITLEMIKEAKRVARQVLILWTPDFHPFHASSAEAAVNTVALEDLLQTACLGLQERQHSATSTIFELV